MQAEHTAVEAVLASRVHEAECLAAENKRLASDWKLREDGLTGSHEIRIEHLMSTLKEREQQNCDLHNQLHKSNVAIESLKAEVATTRQEAKVRACSRCCGYMWRIFHLHAHLHPSFDLTMFAWARFPTSEYECCN